jgi:phytoene synthase
MTDVAASYAICRAMARRSASNFAWAFWLLPATKRMQMYSLYAFLRRTDDLGDNDKPATTRRGELQDWQQSFERALAGEFDDPLLPAIVNTVRTAGIPPKYLTDVVDGVAMDCVDGQLDRPRFATFGELEHYCEHVASAVGLACIHIWGFTDPAAFEPARKCGIAFQLTNILRDLKEDAEQQRIYLPQEDFDRFGYRPEDLRRGARNERFVELMRFEIARAETYYRDAADLEKYLDSAGKRMFGAMITTYGGLLEKIKMLEGGVLDRRVRLSRWRKLRIAARWMLWPPHLSAAEATARTAS